jgi:hypothetical protein
MPARDAKGGVAGPERARGLPRADHRFESRDARGHALYACKNDCDGVRIVAARTPRVCVCVPRPAASCRAPCGQYRAQPVLMPTQNPPWRAGFISGARPRTAIGGRNFLRRIVAAIDNRELEAVLTPATPALLPYAAMSAETGRSLAATGISTLAPKGSSSWLVACRSPLSSRRIGKFRAGWRDARRDSRRAHVQSFGRTKPRTKASSFGRCTVGGNESAMAPTLWFGRARRKMSRFDISPELKLGFGLG